jgi:hypothetical protein
MGFINCRCGVGLAGFCVRGVETLDFDRERCAGNGKLVGVVSLFEDEKASAPARDRFLMYS